MATLRRSGQAPTAQASSSCVQAPSDAPGRVSPLPQYPIGYRIRLPDRRLTGLQVQAYRQLLVTQNEVSVLYMVTWNPSRMSIPSNTSKFGGTNGRRHTSSSLPTEKVCDGPIPTAMWIPRRYRDVSTGSPLAGRIDFRPTGSAWISSTTFCEIIADCAPVSTKAWNDPFIGPSAGP